MRYLKMLGLAAAAAMALTAFLGVSSASATVLCTTTANPCGTGWHVDELTLSAQGTISTHSTGGGIEATCTVAGTTVTKKSTGSATTTPVGEVPITHLTWGPPGSGCTNTTDTIMGGQFEVHWTGGDNGTITASGFQVTVVLAGVTCTFGTGNGLNIGELTGGHPGIVHVNAVIPKAAGSFLCPSDSQWTGTYVVTNHTKVYVVAG